MSRWPEVPLRTIIDRLEPGVSVNGVDEPAKNPGEIGVMKVSCVSNGQFFPEANKRVIPEDLSRVAVNVRDGDIVISRANTFDLVGASGYVTGNYPHLFLSDKLWRVHLRDPKTDFARWLIAVLNSSRLRRDFYRRATGTSGSMKNIGQDALLDIRVPRPPPDAQRRLAAVFETLDQASLVLKRLMKAKQAFKHGVRQQLLTGQTRFPEFMAQAWAKTTIGTVLEEVTRPVTWDETATYTLVSVRRRSGGVFLRKKKKGSDIKVKALYELRRGDIIISTRQVVHGAIARVPDRFDGAHVSGEYMVLVPKGGAAILSEYFDHLARLSHMYHAAFLASYGVDIEKLTFNPRWYLRSSICIPPVVEEQRRIVDVLNALDRELELIAAQGEQIELYKRALLSELVTGTLSVRQ